ncbi:MAG: aminotransferase class I/II-fold pyridoxal phosphate-dependent enzyme [Candidatus Endonucleobacter sp. (ex Gigantidas childressi)]|nr:aminotransferase class I/II-fold pyridoxal phosphate-dependent enzyme [Candidatus Endonucleobacter sp. (ex Gigantidas childressi)]
MKSIIKKIWSMLPSYPHFKMNVFSISNDPKWLKNFYLSLKEDNTDLIKGKSQTLYKKILEKELNSRSIYTFANGRMGFFSILKVIQIQKGDEVIISSYTCVVVSNAILYAEGTPVYCDISKDDFNIDVSKVENLITEKTKVLYAQHTFGQMCNILKLKEIAKKYGLILIEDTALALGAKIEGSSAGTIGDFGYYSTDRSKVINTGLGGVVSVNNPCYEDAFNYFYSKIPYLSTEITLKIANTFLINSITLHPKIYWIGKFVNGCLSKMNFLTYFLDEQFHELDKIKKYPYPARLSSVFAKIGIEEVEKLQVNVESRRKKAVYFNRVLKIYSDRYMQDSQNIFLRYSFLIKNRDYWEKRFESKIDLSIWFKTVTSGKSDRFDEIGYMVGKNKVSEYVCDHIFNIPTHGNIKEERLELLLRELKTSGDILTKENSL